MLERLPKAQIGRAGQLLEWTVEYGEPEPGHRHISHLFALHPGHQITPDGTPELAAAARRTLDIRLSHGGGHTGWIRAWIINFWARLEDGEAAYENLASLLGHAVHPNLFGDHLPFRSTRISAARRASPKSAAVARRGNPPAASAAEGMAERPCNGLRARGGFEVDIAWADGLLTDEKIGSTIGGACKVRYSSSSGFYQRVRIDTEAGKQYAVTLT
jgi:alpha-L-fucosidase 2